MIKVKDGYAKLINTSYTGDISQVLLSNGGTIGYDVSTNTILATIGSNVASANKLKNKVKIWGQDFDGSGNVNGVLTLGTSYITGNDGADILNSEGQWCYLGAGTSEKGFPTYIDGHTIRLRYGTNHTEGVRISSSGNVGIGTTTPKYKLDVNGSIRANGNVLLEAANSTTGGGIAFWDASGWVNGTINAKNLILNYAGGNVGIGILNPSCKLDVNGDIHNTTNIFSNGSFLAASGSDGAYYHGTGISWHNSSNAWVKDLFTYRDSADTLTLHRNTSCIGTATFNNQIISKVADGTAPLVVASTTKVDNLNADLLDGYHEGSFLRYRDYTTTSGASTLWNQIGIRSYHNALPEGLSGLYNYGQAISFPGNGSRLDIFTNHTGSTDTVNQGLWWRSGWENDKRTWRRIIDSGNIGSQSVSYATSAGNADTVDGQHFNWNNNKNDHTYLWAASSSGQAYLVHRASMSVNYATYARYVYCTSGSYLNFQWSGQGGQPTWLFGSNDGANVYVWNPSNFSVNYANSAGNADTVDNLHASDFVRAYGTYGTSYSYDSDWGQSIVTFDPIVSGTAAESNPNVTILNLGNDYNRRKQLWFNYSNNNIYYRRKIDSSWSGWVRLALASEIPTNTWRGITDSYSGTDSTISLSQKGGNALYNALVNGYASSAGSVPWSGVTGKPSTFTPSSHTHDDRYYTESEADSRFVNVSGDTMTGNLTVPSLFINTGDPTLKIYSGRVTDAKSDGNICLQTCIDGQDGQTHSYAPNYPARENLVLQPRGGQVYIGTNPDGGNTSYKLYVNGAIYGTSFSGNVAWGNITGKPSFFSGNYNDLTNKPTIPSVGNGTVNIYQNGAHRGSFSMNQSGNTTINLTDNNTWRSITNSYSGVDTTISLSQKGANDLYKALSGYKSTTASRNTSNTTAGTLQIRQWGPFVNICGRITLKYTNTNTAYVAFTVPSTIGAPVADVGFHITYYGTGSNDDRGCLLYASAGSRTFYFTYNELNNTPSVYINICYFTETSTFTLTKI